MSKPIIRHCRNCEYSKERDSLIGIVAECQVKYITLYKDTQRTAALFCRYYKQKEVGA